MGNNGFFLPPMVFVVVLSYSVTTLFAESPNIATDQSALLALKAHVTHDPLNLLATNWTSGTSVCNWIGVTCGSHHQRVTTLDLSNMNLTGTIPPHLGNLSFLSLLNIRFNHFHGSLPVELANLSSLKYISFGHNNFHGEIPSWFDSFTQLRSLFLYSNNFSGIIPSSLGSLSNLEQLMLMDNYLEGQIPIAIKNLSNLKWLYLENNQLSGQLPSTLFDHLPKLQELVLEFNLFCGKIPISLFKCQELEVLSLADNTLEGSVPQEIGNLTRLSELYLYHNNLTGEVPSIIRSLSFLEYLDLSYNDLSGRLPALQSSLRGLDVSHNNLIGEIPSSICNMSSLVDYFILSSNNFREMIPECLGNLSNSITNVDLSRNNFHGKIPGNFHKGCLLRSFSIHHNKLEGLLPRSLVNCLDLEILDVRNNNLNDTFPNWLGNLGLQVLILRHNRFYGHIDNFEGRFFFSDLRIIDLSHNDFNGFLPTKFFENLHAIRSESGNKSDSNYMMYIGSDQDEYLYHSLSITIKGLDMEFPNILTILTIIDYSNNRFHGQIPEILGELHSLVVLNLSHNSLTGPIPSLLGNLSALESLDLSSNKLEGKIPAQLVNLIFLEVLNLSWNNLVGLVPRGNQFETFTNDSYIGNLGLCGLPLSKNCSDEQILIPQSTKFDEDGDTMNWKFSILMGYGCGLVFGLSMGYVVFTTGKPQWLVRIFERGQQKYAIGGKICRNGGRN
ncbi:receptor-like protein 12 [Herrania umbratica]|uniref:Receptor-like protein 12 n=1 Tax=Herrania umbratica TaxID=108875 RepID=A0A6J1AKZ8_9ROSI|nr:receptor-like protein 12 [Herrania umbratica]